MSKKILEVNRLTISFLTKGQKNRVVNHISFSLHKGETLGIVGESGSGKSVTSLSIIQLLPKKITNIEEGEILFFEKTESPVNLLSLSEKEMQKFRGRKIAMIFQEPMTSLNPVYRCGKQVMEMILAHEVLSEKEAKKRVLSLFEEVLLPDPEKAFKSFPHQLSGGQKQRIMIAMALACHPDILIADEPTTALDVTVQKTILELLANLQKKYQMGIIFISHDLNVVAQIADKTAILYKGEIVEQGETKNVFSNPQHPYTQGLLACRPSLIEKPLYLKTVADFISGRETETIQTTPENLFIPDYSKPPILRLDHISVLFPLKKNIFGKVTDTFPAVNKVSLEVYKGETLGLVGESGCGKTTLGRTILQLIQNSEGNILYKGQRLNTLSPSKLLPIRKNLQIIFQDPYASLNPRLTVGEAIMEPMQVHQIGRNARERKEKAVALLLQVGLKEDHLSRYPHEFSGGQRQRICIARALALEPELIICDESVSALDVSVQAQVLNLLNDLKRKFHFTYIFISHDLSVVKFMSDRIAVMQKGEIVELGNAETLYRNPQVPYTRKLINSIPDIHNIWDNTSNSL